MITRKVRLRPSTPCLHCSRGQLYPGMRQAHAQARITRSSMPDPTPFVPDHNTFLILIGRKMSQHASKIQNWQSLFSLTSTQLRELGVEPARTRRYLLWWREKFRKGEYGIGGDLKHVKDGEAEVRAVEVMDPEGSSQRNVAPKLGMEGEVLLPLMRRMVINSPPETINTTATASQLQAIKGMKVRGRMEVVGPFVTTVKGTKGSVGRIKVREGMWEVRRGVIKDGGERRQKEVRRKRLLAQRKSGKA